MRVVGLDIGGANLKASDGEHQSVSRPFAVWEEPQHLGTAVQDVLSQFRRPQHLAVTMTAELADCFATKAEGVEHILSALEQAVDVPVHVWQRGGEFITPDQAREFLMLVAAANWHALATWAGRMAPAGCALLLDMGSTTTDIVPLVDGLPATESCSDFDRLTAGELVYTGCRRTSVCAVTKAVRIADRSVDLAAELFATMLDVHLILGQAPEDCTGVETADGRAATVDAARSRLARMICCDRTEVSDDELHSLALQVENAQQQTLTGHLERVLQNLPGSPDSVLLAGEGELSLRRLVADTPSLQSCDLISLQGTLGPEHSQAACALALARLGNERIR